jgi:hypothetical protein
MIPRYTGVDADGVVKSQTDHFGNCPVCGALVDMHNLGQVLAHIHDGQIEILEGAEWPFRAGQVQ